MLGCTDAGQSFRFIHKREIWTLYLVSRFRNTLESSYNMLISHFSVVLLLVVAVACKEFSDNFCDPALCKTCAGDPPPRHVACLEPGASLFGSDCPSNAVEVEMTQSLQDLLVSEHNKVRNEAATGQLPGFSPCNRMIENVRRIDNNPHQLVTKLYCPYRPGAPNWPTLPHSMRVVAVSPTTNAATPSSIRTLARTLPSSRRRATISTIGMPLRNCSICGLANRSTVRWASSTVTTSTAVAKSDILRRLSTISRVKSGVPSRNGAATREPPRIWCATTVSPTSVRKRSTPLVKPRPNVRRAWALTIPVCAVPTNATHWNRILTDTRWVAPRAPARMHRPAPTQWMVVQRIQSLLLARRQPSRVPRTQLWARKESPTNRRRRSSRMSHRHKSQPTSRRRCPLQDSHHSHHSQSSQHFRRLTTLAFTAARARRPSWRSTWAMAARLR